MSQATCGALLKRLIVSEHLALDRKSHCSRPTTYGFLIGELIRRVDGRGPRQFLKEEVFDKVGADFQIGLSSPDELQRLAPPAMPKGAFVFEGMAGRLAGAVEMVEGSSWERMSSQNAGGGGVSNARAIARVCAIVANGGTLDGVRILSPEVVALAGAEHVYGQCPYIGWMRLGLGFGIDSKEFPSPTPTTMHWGGFGGSVGLMDPRTQFSFGYAPNNWVVPDVSSGQLAVDKRPMRFLAALMQTMPELAS